MTNPCEVCIVDVMCREKCELLEEYLQHLLYESCEVQDIIYTWRAVPSADLGKELRFRHAGRMILDAIIKGSDYKLHIFFDKGKIHSIMRYPTIFSKDGKRRMALYNPREGVKLYDITNESM